MNNQNHMAVSSNHHLTFYLETYGCQMNVSDSEIITSVLKQDGMTPTDSIETADVILMNTCAVREHAEQRVLGRVSQINKFKLKKKSLIVGVVGCMAQRMGVSLSKKAPYVDVTVGPDGYRHLPTLISNNRESHQHQAWLKLDQTENYQDIKPDRSDSPHAWVTIMRGCNKRCTFCIVPHVRGRERSRPHIEIESEVQNLVENGVKEITLLGQTVNAYHDGQVGFADLLRKLNRIHGLERIRFTSPHPYDMTEDAMVAMAECEKVCEHLHFPVQSGSDRILKRMVRLYKIDEYRRKVERLRELMPHIGLTTDVIVGFPGETEEDFQATHDLMVDINFHTSYLFKFSFRDGTAATHFYDDRVPDDVSQERLTRLIALQRSQTHERSQSMVGQSVEVLVQGEGKRENQSRGRNRQNQMVVFPKNNENLGDLIHIRVTEASGWTLIGKQI